MNYIDKVNKLVGIMLQAEENHESVEIIGDTDSIYDVAVELQDELGKRFFQESEEDDFDYLLKHTDILSLAITRDEFGVLYFLSEAIYEGVTLESEADTFYVHENIYNKLDTDRLIGDVVILKEFNDDEEFYQSEQNEMAEIIDDEFEEIIANTINYFNSNHNDEDFCWHCVFKDLLSQGYRIGYKNGIIMTRNALDDILDDIE